MAEHTIDASGTSDDLARVLERLLQLTGTHRDPERVREAASDATEGLRAAGEKDVAWATRVLRALAAVGLRGAPFAGDPRDVGRRVGLGQPLITRGRLDGDVERTLVLSDRRGRRMCVEDPATQAVRWVRASQLATMVHVPPSWIAVDAAMPLESIGARTTDGVHDHPRPVKRLAAWIRLEHQDLWAVLIYAAASGVLGLTTPLAVQALVSTVAFGTVRQPLVVLGLLLFGALTLAAVLRALEAWIVEVLQRRFFARVVGDLAHRLPHVRRDALDGAHAPELANRFFDVFTAQKTAAALLLGGLDVVLTVAVGLVVLAFYHPLLLALDVLVVVALALAVLARARRGAETAIEESRAKYAVGAWLEELARHHGELKLAGGQRWARDRADDLARGYLVARERHFRVAFQQFVSLLAVQAVTSAVVLGVGGWLVIARQLTLGQLVASEIVVTVVVTAVANLGRHLEHAYDLLAALDKLGHLSDLPIERDDGRPAEVSGRARLKLEGVRAGHRGTEILTGVDLEVAPGERLVIDGPSGGGKSLLVELIAGIRMASAGRLEIDGHDVRDLSLSALRRRIAAVTRTATVAASVLDNVRLGRPEIDAGRARAALATVGLLAEIEALEAGLNTPLLPDGAPLSEGQVVRLTIARAIASEPALLLVDHVLDGMDDASRGPVLDALFDRAAPWTLVLVSAERDLASRADRALTLRGGTLEERSPR